MEKAISQWSRSQASTQESDAFGRVQDRLRRSYVVYGDMLLLPAAVIDSSDWQTLSKSCGEEAIKLLFTNICHNMRITHIACNHPIPLHIEDASTRGRNDMRSPTHFRPLYGDFGSAQSAQPPTHVDFDDAYWVTARQNGIAQTWAPRWTMFSRGNITEKARVLKLPSVAQAVADGNDAGTGCSAVDLYAGIGYFSFSYVKAGVAKVLCWEVNQWSCEGLRRGAESNKWRHKTWREDADAEVTDTASKLVRMVIFEESNEHASERLRILRHRLPPVRHVNCGLLPSSRPSWRIAFEALDADQGGWVHVHENFALDDIEACAEDVRQAFQEMLDEVGTSRTPVVLENIIRVKSYAPGVFHCVLDLFVPPKTGTVES